MWSAGRLTDSTPISRSPRKQNTEKLPLSGSPRSDASVVTDGDAGDLQFEVALVAPEPRHLVVGADTFAGDAGGDRARLVDAVLHRFEANPA